MRTFAAVVLSGGTASRLDGADKASVEIGGATLLERALDAVAAADEIVVVGEPVTTVRPVTFTREDPPLGGPVAGIVAGVAALSRVPEVVVVLAVDMAGVRAATVARLLAATEGRDGAWLHDTSGRRQLAGTLTAAALPLLPARPHGTSMHAALGPLGLAAVAATADEADDVDTWDDVRRLRDRLG